ncbi:phenylalanine--tRNA ligase subunit beta [Candidatus Poribacteria bacterium]|nr:phenylalanine--tRNA ligase subunit beta [Candidatus Poribacteria bacterium]MYK24200.1 phenylalanine--tRNA ligase subunit beta [Candidatus Poribacteria bacterium]
MNVTLNWLKNYIDFDLSPSELADRLTMLGVEVESVKQLGAELEGVVVGSVRSIKPHPNADKLVLCQVDIGETEELQIVCGAPNVREGIHAPVATIGATLPIGLTIKRAKLRGETSHGMLCSKKELGLSEDAAGLMELPTDTPLGTSISAALGLDDVVFELEITPNRPDCLSLIGVAREIRAETGNALKLPQVDFNEAETDIREITSVTIETSDLCPRYAARVIRGVKVGQSPAWLQQRLESVGIGVINNIVDITNFVLMEYGQPLHAFDYHKLAENRIVVRRATAGENITTLDGIDRELTSDMLVIADAEKPVALAGVMGGYDSEITETTADVLLESAYFNPSSIRATAKALGISTEASYRFERGADIGAVLAALDRAAQLITELAGGTICKGVVDVYPGSPPVTGKGRQQSLTDIQLRPERVNFILGTTLDPSEMVQILSDLGFDVKANGENYQISVPTFRSDVTREIDLIEEIARVYGYDNIPTTSPKGDIPIPAPNPSTEVRKRIKHFLLAAGMMEAINYSFCDPNGFDKIRFAADHPRREVLKLQNPLSPEMSVLRTTLLPSLLENAQHNRNHQIDTIALFEIGSVFIRNGAEKEPERVTGILAGQVGEGVYSNPFREPDFYDIKGLAEGILEVCGIVDYTLEKTDAPTFHPGRNAAVLSSNKQIGIFGEAHPEVLENYDLPYKAYLFDFDMEALVDAAIFAKRFEPIPVYPKVERDLAIVVDKEILSDMPTGLIYATGGELVESVRLFDVYEGEQVPEGKKSLAYAITYHSATETLTDKAINALHNKVVKHLNQELGAELRM